MERRNFILTSLNYLWHFIRSAIIIVVIAFIIRYLAIQPFIVDGNSMEPNFHHRQFILVNKITYRFSEPKAGDVVVFRSPEDPRVYYIKRVVAVPHDEVLIKNNHLYVNNQLQNETYLPSWETTKNNFEGAGAVSTTLKDNEYYVLGDNRDESSDSREWGPLPRLNIVGRYWFTIYSPASAGANPAPALGS